MLKIFTFTLNYKEQQVFDYITGRHGKQCLQKDGKIDYTAIAKATSPNRIRSCKIRNKIYSNFKRNINMSSKKLIQTTNVNSDIGFIEYNQYEIKNLMLKI